MARSGCCILVYQILGQAHLKEKGLTETGDHDTLKSHNP